MIGLSPPRPKSHSRPRRSWGFKASSTAPRIRVRRAARARDLACSDVLDDWRERETTGRDEERDDLRFDIPGSFAVQSSRLNRTFALTIRVKSVFNRAD